LHFFISKLQNFHKHPWFLDKKYRKHHCILDKNIENTIVFRIKSGIDEIKILEKYL